MPCYDGRDQITATSVRKSEELAQVRKLLDERTAMLCEAMGILHTIAYKSGYDFVLSSSLEEWWQAHQRWDAERREQGR